MALHFHPLTVARIAPDTAGSAAISLAVPPPLLGQFDFRPGQFLTLRARIDGQEVRRSYSICSTPAHLHARGELEVGIKQVEGGTFSNWALSALREGDTIDVLPPEGRFTPTVPGARHRAGFAAGSGITPLLSIIGATLESEPHSRFTLVYGNQRVATIMFNEALADLKDRYPERLTLIHVLSRQPLDIPLLHGRLDAARVTELLRTLVPARFIDEAFICGPEGMIDATEQALRAAGIARERIHTERFTPSGQPTAAPRQRAQADAPDGAAAELDLVADGKTWHLRLTPGQTVLAAGLAAGLDLPYSCQGGVCCTCRAKVLEGSTEMSRNFTLEAQEMAQGFVLTCQAHATSARLVVSYDER